MSIFGIIKYYASFYAFQLCWKLFGLGRAEALFDRLFWHRPLIDEDEIYGDD